MKHETNSPIIPRRLSWVQCSASGRTPFWCYTRRLLIDAEPEDHQLIIHYLTEGKTLYLEESDMTLRAGGFSRQDQKRYRHLLTFQTDDFKLTGFRADSAIYSMSEMAERKFMPKPTVYVDPLNKAIYQGTTLLDVFIPVKHGPSNFYFATNTPL